MKKIRAGFTAIVLVAAICVTNVGTAFATEEEKEEKGFWSSVGGWFIDRGSDIGNAVTVAADATGQWFVDRGEDICEVTGVVGGWVGDRANDVYVLVTDTGEMIVCAASNFDPSKLATMEYYLDSGEKLILGDYSDKDPTALSIGGNLVASVLNVDLGMDVRDLVYDCQHLGSEDVTLSGIALDSVAVLPVIGVLKYVKYADTVADVAKSVDTAVDVADTVHDTAKVVDAAADTAKAADAIDDVADTAKAADEVTDAAKTADLVDDAADAGKEISKISFEELPEGVQENYKRYADCGWDGEKALEDMTDGSSAGKLFENRDGDLPIIDSAGNKLSYTEYDVFSLGEAPDFDPERPWLRGWYRFVRDNLGNIYFTKDHYNSFTLITDAIVG